MESDNLRHVWRRALADYEACEADNTHEGQLEQEAWDAFRDQCEIDYPDGVCPHPECPQ